MKKYILSTIIFALCLQVFSQETYLIRHKPQNTNGFLVLENNFQVGIRYWSIEIILNFYEDFELVNQEVIERYDLIGKNYLKIPQEFLTMDNVSARITAFFQNDIFIEDEIAISSQTLGGPNWELFKEFTCNGSSYAYRIEQFKHKNVDKSYLTLKPAEQQIDPIVFFYEYFPFSLLNTVNPHSYVNNIYTPPNLIEFWRYYGIPYNSSPQLALNEPYVMKISNTSPPGLYTNSGGSPVLGPHVLAIKKGLGPWAHPNLTGNCLKTVEIQTIDIPDIQTAIMYMNSYGSPVPCGLYPLSCDNIAPLPGMIAPLLNQEFGKREIYTWHLDTVWFWWDLFWPFQNIVNLEINEILEPYSEISVSQISGTGNLIGGIKIEDMFDSEGTPIQIPIQLNPGLYNITFHFNDGSFLRVVEEKINENYNPNSMSSQLNAIIYPVPIQENVFFMNLFALEDLEFKYVLYDFYGTPIFDTNISINEGHTESIQIEPRDGIPNGFLINVFYFDDGSQLSILTMKTE
jgi:hypothetical protein